MSEHTPTPWHRAPPYIDIIYGPDQSVICHEPINPDNGKNWNADAAFIVKAVNNHDSLVKALRLFADPTSWRQSGSCDPNSGAFRRLQIAQDALAAVEGAWKP